MKVSKILFAFVLASLTFSACDDDKEIDDIIAPEPEPDPEPDPDPVDDANENANVGEASSIHNLCVPRLNDGNIYVDYYVTNADTAVFNYALEWNEAKLHSQWVAFEFNKLTRQQNVKRSSIDFTWDTNISTKKKVEPYMHTSDGYDRGHLCASADRLYSKEANEQTFFLSNVSPMIGKVFNQGYWNDLEALFRRWCLNSKYDQVYVTKGATLDDLLINFKGTVKANDSKLPTTDASGKTIKGLYVPKYYYMAILTEKAGEYHAMAFLVEHKEYLSPTYGTADFKQNAVSIDDLEEFIGVDLFCNLPDDIEAAVESTYTPSDWMW